MPRNPPHDFHKVYVVQQLYSRLMERISYEIAPFDKKFRVMAGGEVLHIANTEADAVAFGEEWQAQFDAIAAAVDDWFGPAFEKATADE